SASVLSACETPVKKAIPYLNKPEEVIPGKASWYASSFVRGNEYCPVLIRSRDGRPVKVEGNPLSEITRGGTSARVQASVLSLYDNASRYKNPVGKGESITWQQADQEIASQLDTIRESGGRMVMVAPTLLSPSTMALLNQFRESYPALEIIHWDPLCYSAIRQAHQQSFGRSLVPEYRFDKAHLIISFSADFLGSWLSPIEYAHDYAAGRKLDQQKSMSQHIHFESAYSLTGANADERIPVKPSTEKQILMALYDAVARATGNPTFGASPVAYDVDALAGQIIENHSRTLMVCGHNEPDMQALVNGINYMSGAYGNTISIERPLLAGMGQEEAFENLVKDLNQGNVEAIFFYNSNPLYSYHNASQLEEGIKKTALSISFAGSKDETAAACQYILPDHHYLESWNDAQFKAGHYSLTQPLIHPLFDTRQFQDSLLRWSGSTQRFDEFLQSNWQQSIATDLGSHPDFLHFWRDILQKGVYQTAPSPAEALSFSGTSVAEPMKKLMQSLPTEGADEYSLVNSITMADGQDANNPWLQELPHPVSSVTWDNYAAISPDHAHDLGLAEGAVIRLNDRLEVPLLIQPGQAYGCLSIALGYGRTHAGVVADHTGSNGFRLVSAEGPVRKFSGIIQSLEQTGAHHEFARTQTHFSMEGRAIVRETNLEEYLKDPASGNEHHYYAEKHKATLYPGQEFPGHHWVMMVDLNACVGCGTCVISCQSENNIPVIGKEEVRRRRIMHWIRIDRYYSGSPANPKVIFQPLMCQHCDHAPCENVCPVAATPHSSEGLNQMAYNRCVGTKYCINNCPYKVRRFNWYAYAQKEQFNKYTATQLGRMVLNPDVTVRERGVVEKCSFCIQRIQEAKMEAKIQGRPLTDGEVAPACVSACPAKALIFGDSNNKDSRISQMLKDPRNYHLLEELHTLPSVGYLTKVRNPLSNEQNQV
ncbi:MAG: 4Fe-4S dicluster domain-containing protein, partial [Bacteroidales bacterium]